MPPNRTNVTKRACDGCKVRKIRCGGGQPCKACMNARIKCSYVRVQQQRGPQRLRATTTYLIEQAQRGENGEGLESSGGAGVMSQNEEASTSLEQSIQTGTGQSRIPVHLLAPVLYIYCVRMYPVWPIVDVECLISILQQDQDATGETYALATSVAAATIAQLRLGPGSLPDETVTADTLAEECLKARRRDEYKSKVDLNNVCTSFFLHVYYENQQSGGSESLLYLREAISLAQMMGLHRESSYAALALEEQQIRRRVLWLLFVTERGVCILRKLPVVLRTNVSAPEVDDANDQAHVLPAFLKLLNLFRLFERSKMFDIIEGEAWETEAAGDKLGFMDDKFLETLQDKLEDGSVLFDHISDVQKADLCVTRHWMRMILWRLSSKQNASYQQRSQRPTSASFPVAVARELLNIVSQLPRPAIEAHGLGMELKLYEIANSLADSIMRLAMLPYASSVEFESRPSSILSRLHSILSTFRGGGNKTLVDMLYKKMAAAESRSAPALAKPLQPPMAPGTSRSPGKAIGASHDAAALAGLMEHARLPHIPSGAADDDLFCIAPLEIGFCDDHLPGMQSATSYGMASGQPYMNYAGDHDYSSTGPMHALQEPADSSAFAASWPFYDPVEMVIGDFLAQVPGTHFLEESGLEAGFMDGYMNEQALTEESVINSL